MTFAELKIGDFFRQPCNYRIGIKTEGVPGSVCFWLDAQEFWRIDANLQVIPMEASFVDIAPLTALRATMRDLLQRVSKRLGEGTASGEDPLLKEIDAALREHS